MVKATYYPPADSGTQNFTQRYRGVTFTPNVVVLHSTEGTSWPSYDGGANAPNLTVKPDIANKRMVWRQHFPLNMSSRALRNLSGGVETNTLNSVQVEIIGTCDPTKRERWGNAVEGRDYFYLPDAPEWVLKGIADFLRFMHEEWDLRLQTPDKWPAYPTSYANGGQQRFTFAEWRRFYGVCGHMHVPENAHGDPGNIKISRILELAKATDTPKPKKTGRADRVFEIAKKAVKANSGTDAKRWKRIRKIARKLSTKY